MLVTSTRAGAQSKCRPELVNLELEDHPHPGSHVRTPEIAHSTSVILDLSGLRESCYITVMVCMGKGREHSRAWGVSEAGVRMGGSPSTEDCSGDVYHAFGKRTIPSPCQPLGYLMPYWPLGFRPQVSLYCVKLALSGALLFTVGRRVLYLNGYTRDMMWESPVTVSHYLVCCKSMVWSSIDE